MTDQNLIDNEIERIEIFFQKNNYNDEQKVWFIESKLYSAKANNDPLLIEVCNKLLEKIKKN